MHDTWFSENKDIENRKERCKDMEGRINFSNMYLVGYPKKSGENNILKDHGLEVSQLTGSK